MTALAGLLFAGLYLFRPAFMPYHEIAVGRPWNELEPGYRMVVLALMRVSGGGFLAASVAIIVLLLIPFRHDRYWARIVIPVIALAELVPVLVATLNVKIHSLATPPYVLVSILVALLFASLVITLLNKKN